MDFRVSSFHAQNVCVTFKEISTYLLTLKTNLGEKKLSWVFLLRF